jgi:hypothetical protein
MISPGWNQIEEWSGLLLERKSFNVNYDTKSRISVSFMCREGIAMAEAFDCLMILSATETYFFIPSFNSSFRSVKLRKSEITPMQTSALNDYGYETCDL